MQKYLTPLFLCLISLITTNMYAQEIITISKTFKYTDNNVLRENGIINTYKNGLTSFGLTQEIETAYPKVKIISFIPIYEGTSLDSKYLSILPNSTKPDVAAYKSRNKSFLDINIFPFINTPTGVQRVTQIDMQVEISSGNANVLNKNIFNSVLKDGNVYKIAINSKGIYKLDYNFLKSTVGIDIDNIDPRRIKIYSNGGGRLPEKNSAFRYDDIEENAIYVEGEEDGSFDATDYILFYGDGPHKWYYNKSQDKYRMENNIYDSNTYYFIKIDIDNGLRINERPSISNTEITINKFQDYGRKELEKYNPLHEYEHSTGTGQDFVGEYFQVNRDLSLPDVFTFANMIDNPFNNIKARFYARAFVSSQFELTMNNQVFTKTLPLLHSNSKEDNYTLLRKGSFDQHFDNISDQLSIDVHYNETGNVESKGWLDYIEINAMRSLKDVGNQMAFRNHIQDNYTSTSFNIESLSNTARIWDITDITKPVFQSFEISNDIGTFGLNNNNITHEFIIVNTPYETATFVEKVGAQNLHGIDNIDMVILYPPSLKIEAERLAEHRRQNDPLDLVAIDINQVWNEFGSGKKDVTAIRDFMRMLYLRNPDKFKYLLLFGDASFDFKDIYGFTNKNLIPTYETASSTSETTSYPTDDYYTLMDEDEGTLGKGLDIAVGRIPVNNLSQAKGIVDKIIRYDTNPKMFGDWKNSTTHLADDQDTNTHVRDQDNVTNEFWAKNEIINANKIYFDAFEQITTSGGNFFPKVTEAINNSIFQGQLFMNYMGHGGPGGWAQERVLKINQIINWTNINKLPLIITATCSFTGYDDPTNTSAGEYSILNKKGGAIGLFSTVRAVFTTSNRLLNDAVMDNILIRDSNLKGKRIGEILRLSKVGTPGTGHENNDKFQCIGDPSMRIKLPEHKIRLTSINVDTIHALDQIHLEGEIITQDSLLLSDFNGKIFTKVFDKKIIEKTLGQDADSQVKPYTQQNSILFKGISSVVDGKFTVDFVVPQDINYNFGYGKISFYAHNNVDQEAAGYVNDIIIGGTSDNPVQDDTPPLVEVFMNDENFVSGGLTESSPILIAKITDDYGINLASSSIGHELSGLLDDDFAQNYVLNSFYESELNDSKRGMVTFPLQGISEGLHKIKVRAWDIANNFGDGETEFLVANSTNSLISHVLNYPNPFFSNTSFQFEHNLARTSLEVDINIFNISGKLIKTIQRTMTPEGNRVTDIEWDGTDNYGDRLANGVYLYKVKLRPDGDSNLVSESDFQKLVILNK